MIGINVLRKNLHVPSPYPCLKRRNSYDYVKFHERINCGLRCILIEMMDYDYNCLDIEAYQIMRYWLLESEGYVMIMRCRA